jgi:hypothetical protein
MQAHTATTSIHNTPHNNMHHATATHPANSALPYTTSTTTTTNTTHLQLAVCICNSVSALQHCLRLPSQASLLRAQRGCLADHQPQVCRHFVTRCKFHHITRYQLTRWQVRNLV